VTHCLVAAAASGGGGSLAVMYRGNTYLGERSPSYPQRSIKQRGNSNAARNISSSASVACRSSSSAYSSLNASRLFNAQ